MITIKYLEMNEILALNNPQVLICHETQPADTSCANYLS